MEPAEADPRGAHPRRILVIVSGEAKQVLGVRELVVVLIVHLDVVCREVESTFVVIG